MNPGSTSGKRLVQLIVLLRLGVAILAVYAQVYRFDFVNLDDSAHVFQNS
jgi:hypothetical protein